MNTNDQCTEQDQEAIRRAAQFRMGYLRWLAAKLRSPIGIDPLIRGDAAAAILQLIGDEQ